MERDGLAFGSLRHPHYGRLISWVGADVQIREPEAWMWRITTVKQLQR